MLLRNPWRLGGKFVFRGARTLTVKGHLTQQVASSWQVQLHKRLRNRQRLLKLGTPKLEQVAVNDEHVCQSANFTDSEPRTTESVEHHNASSHNASVSDITESAIAPKQEECVNGSDEYGYKYEGQEPTTYGDWSHKGRVTDF